MCSRLEQNATHDYRQFSYNEYRELRENGGDLFVDLAALEFGVAGIGRDHEMRRSFAFLTSENFFSLMGVQPVRGRFYTAEECRPNANIPVVVAVTVFGSAWEAATISSAAISRSMGDLYTVIGVTPDGFSGVSALVAPDVWLPLGVHSSLGSAFADSETLHDLAEPKNYALNLTARLRPGITIETAKSRLPALTRRFNASQPMQKARESYRFINLRDSASAPTRRRRAGNAHRYVIDGNGRRGPAHRQLESCEHVACPRDRALQEIALRLAVGASRWRIVRQLLCEGLLLAICGGVVGLVVSVWCNDLFISTTARLAVNFSFVVKLHPDATVLAVTLLFCLIATMLFSLGPALKATKVDLVNDLKEQVGEPARIGRFSRFFAPRHVSVMAQIALSFMLLFAPVYFFGALLRRADLIPGLLRPAIW